MPRWVVSVLFLQCVGVRGTPVGVVAPVGVTIRVTGLSDLVGSSTGRSEWLSLMSRWAWLWCHQISACRITVICPGVFGIGYKGRALTGSSSLDTAPVTGSLLFNAPVCHLAVYCAAGFSSCVLFGGCDSIWLAVLGLFVRRVSVDFVMATDGDATSGARSGITFGVMLDVPWNAPEAIVHLHSDGVVDLDTVLNVLGLTGRRPEAAVVRVLQGRDERSVHAFIPDPRVLERGFHDVTIVDMDDLPVPSVSQDDSSGQ